VPSRRKPDNVNVKTVQLSIDRIETGKSEIAVLLSDDGTTIDVPRRLLPDGARPGDVLVVTFRRDLEATRRVAEETRQVQDDLKATDPGGDIRL
jgi:Protein of unknown function (DUF3006)